MEKVYIIQPIVNGENISSIHDEAISLIKSANAQYIGSSFQKIKEINPSTFIGSGKLIEINTFLTQFDEDVTLLFNGELSPSQTLNISASLNNRKVIDRTTLILDIFAKNALTSEGKIQVELAQLKYIYPRLKGKGAALSRLGGGIGSRGPGETQLETDKRHIRLRIKYLENKLNETSSRRALIMERRSKENIQTISLVGYTNTGKSTLLNTLTNANVLTKNVLFATLDPTSRNFTIDDVYPFLLIDTVGFIQRLPTTIIEAFKSTLEVAVNSQLAIIVADATADFELQFKTTLSTLYQLGYNGKIIKVLNKCEGSLDVTLLPSDCILISAKYHLGLDALKREIISKFSDVYSRRILIISYDSLSEYNKLTKYIYEKNREYFDNYIKVDCVVEVRHIDLFKKFIKENEDI